MAYGRSVPLQQWLDERQASLSTLAAAHAAMGEVDGPGRPLEIGRPVGHAYILRVVAEFQGFARDLHALAAERFIGLAGVDIRFVPVMTEAITAGRYVDSGNPGLRSLNNDFRRVGVQQLQAGIAKRLPQWAKQPGGDKETFESLIALRNALAHGNQAQLDDLRRQGIADTISWSRRKLPTLNRMARAMDKIVWENHKQLFGAEPW